MRLSGYFIQLLRYTAPPDARCTTVLLRSVATASLAVERKSELKRGIRDSVKSCEKLPNVAKLIQNVAKRCKRREKVAKGCNLVNSELVSGGASQGRLG